MGQGACAGYQKQKKTKKEGGVTSTKQISSEADDISEITDRHNTNNNNNNYQIKNNNSSDIKEQDLNVDIKMVEEYKKKIAALEAEIANRDTEIDGLRQAISRMPEFSSIDGDVCFKINRSISEDGKENKAAGRPKRSIMRKESSANLMLSYKPQTINPTRRQIEDYCRDLVINNDHICTMEKGMRLAIDHGLNKKTHDKATVKCFPTYVPQLPSGKETGKFLALDLGGTNFRVVVIDIGKDKFEMDSKVYAISRDIMTGSGEGLFDHIAECLAHFIKDRGIDKQVLPLGFTFSFPCRQKGLASGELINWTKGFTCPGVEGEDVVQLLQKSISKRSDVRVDVTSILNDTTGCLMSCAWKNANCRIGLIIGTGTNACYLEDIDKVEMIDGQKSNGQNQMIVNTEWGAFGNKGELDYIVTKWDRRVDKASVNPGKQIFEKMISGMYMGEVVRQVLVDLYEEGLIFVGQPVDNLLTHGRFYTKYVSEVESDPVGEFTLARGALKDLGIEDVNDEDCSAVRYICECVSRRAGFMVSAGITALLKKMDYKDVVVAIDGSVFRYHPHFPNIMRSRIAQLMGIDYKFDLMLSTDGSGRGAALVAAVLCGQCEI